MQNKGKKPLYSLQELQEQINVEINASAIPKCKSGNTPVILVRNSKTAVKRAIKEYKQELKDKSYGLEHEAMIHQMINSEPKMNLIIKCN